MGISTVGRHDVGYGRRPRLMPQQTLGILVQIRDSDRQFLLLPVVDSSSTPKRNACLLTFFDAGGVDFVKSFHTYLTGLAQTAWLRPAPEKPDGRPTNGI